MTVRISFFFPFALRPAPYTEFYDFCVDKFGKSYYYSNGEQEANKW